MIAFELLALLFIAYALLNAWQRPGLFAAVVLNSFVYSQYFGPLGIATSVAAVIVVTSVMVDRRYRQIPLERPEWALIAWLFVMVASVLVSWRMDNALTIASQLAIYAYANYGMGRTFGSRPGFVRDIVIGSIVTLVLCEPALLAASQAFSGRLSGDLNPVGTSLMVDLPLVSIPAIVMFEPTLSWRARAGLTALLLLVVIPVAVSMGTRGVFIAGGITFAVLLCYRAWFGGITRVLAWTTAILAVGGVAVTIALGFFQNSIIGLALGLSFERLSVNFGGETGGLVVDQSAAERVRAIHQAYELFLNAPVLGHGIGSFSYMTNNTLGYPHNTLLEILVSAGVVGLTLFLVGLVPIVWRGTKKAAQRPANWEAILTLGLFVDIFVRMQLSMSITMGKLIFLSLGMMVAQSAASRLASESISTVPVQPLPSTPH